MDLTTLKRNLSKGRIRTMAEFQRDLMLMFQNAVMYNDSDHHIYHMAVEMQREVLEQIQVLHYPECCRAGNRAFGTGLLKLVRWRQVVWR